MWWYCVCVLRYAPIFPFLTITRLRRSFFLLLPPRPPSLPTAVKRALTLLRRTISATTSAASRRAGTTGVNARYVEYVEYVEEGRRIHITYISIGGVVQGTSNRGRSEEGCPPPPCVWLLYCYCVLRSVWSCTCVGVYAVRIIDVS